MALGIAVAALVVSVLLVMGPFLVLGYFMADRAAGVERWVRSPRPAPAPDCVIGALRGLPQITSVTHRAFPSTPDQPAADEYEYASGDAGGLLTVTHESAQASAIRFSAMTITSGRMPSYSAARVARIRLLMSDAYVSLSLDCGPLPPPSLVGETCLNVACP